MKNFKIKDLMVTLPSQNELNEYERDLNGVYPGCAAKLSGNVKSSNLLKAAKTCEGCTASTKLDRVPVNTSRLLKELKDELNEMKSRQRNGIAL